MSRRIDRLLPQVQVDLNAALAELTAKGILYFVDSTLRTTDEQMAYYAQGRQSIKVVNSLRTIAGLYLITEKDNSYTITNCDGVNHKSLHQSGKAVDIVPVDSRGRPYWPVNGSNTWKAIASVLVKHNFIWGGEWTKIKNGIDPDSPHYEHVS